MVAGWRTADDGSYQLTVPAGTYQVSFDDCATGSEYASQWWDHVADRSSASAVPVSCGEQVTGVSAALATQAPGLPGPVTARPGVRQVSLSWTPPDNQGAPVTGYDIYRLSDPTLPRSLIASNAPGTSYIDSGLADNTTYSYFVAAVNSARAGDSQSASARTFQAPLPPQSVTTDVINSSTITLSWPASFDGGDSPVTGYNVYRSTDPNSRGSAIMMNDQQTWLSDSGLQEGLRYYYVVTAVNAVGESPPSAQVSDVPYPSPTVAVTATPPGATTSHSATFAFTGADPGNRPLSFECGLDRQALAACTSPVTYTSVLEGHHIFHVTVSDSDGQANAKDAAWIVDDTAPTGIAVEGMPPIQRSGLHRVAVDAQDSGSGVASYDLRYRSAQWNGQFGGYTHPARWQHDAFNAVQFAGARGHTYCFSARARDRAGNVSSWSAERCTAILLDDRTLSASPGWTRGLSTYDYAGTFTRTTRSGARLTLPGATLDRLALLVVQCPSCGTIAVYLNGHHWGEINTRSTTTHHQYVSFGHFPLRKATVTLVVTSRGENVIIDGLGVSRA